ncbi:hypothetical protein LTR66_011633 [Elasticomyces elasticus]|nr:hypothetical protein LTR66_011633 [Elasticomyces elasticus]KAK4971877.1 hypothetical protein LTR28_012953 [Elasticomyces elasticus]
MGRKARIRRARRTRADQSAKRSRQQSTEVVDGMHPSIKRHHVSQSLVLTSPKEAKQPTQPPTLGDRFFALPAEIRNAVYRLLIVQPTKWDVPHKADCTPDGKAPRSVAFLADGSYIGRFDCADCGDVHLQRCRNLTSAWRVHRPTIFVNPARSQWAPEQRNPYLCTDCYNFFRTTPFPELLEMPCLCARRQNLQLFLVNRRMRDEATHVFYTENTFSFEKSSLLLAFFANLPQRYRDIITSVNMIPGMNKGRNTVRMESHKRLAPVWAMLKTLPRLCKLELDEGFLEKWQMVMGIRTLHGLKHLHLFRPFCGSAEDPAHFPWPMYAYRTDVTLECRLAETLRLECRMPDTPAAWAARKEAWCGRRGASNADDKQAVKRATREFLDRDEDLAPARRERQDESGERRTLVLARFRSVAAG